MRAKAYFFLSLVLLLASLAILQRSLRPQPVSAAVRMASFARHIEGAAAVQRLSSESELQQLLDREVASSRGSVLAATWESFPAPRGSQILRVKLSHGAALIGAYPIHFSGRRVTLRLATWIPASHKSFRA